MFELNINTEFGKFTVIVVSEPVSLIENVYVGYLKEKPGVIVQSESIDEVISDLKISLRMMIEVENEIKNDNKTQPDFSLN